MRISGRFVIALLMTSLAIAPIWAGDDAGGMTSEVITLRNAMPTSVMWSLKMLSTDNFLAGKTAMFSSFSARPELKDYAQGPISAAAGSSESASSEQKSGAPTGPELLAPEGIKMVAPYDADHALVIYGDSKFFPEFVSKVRELDIVPRQVQIKAEVFRLSDKLAKGLKLTSAENLRQADDKTIQGIRAGTKDGAANAISCPMISTLDRMAASIMTSMAGVETTLRVIPKIMEDGGITLYINWRMTRPGTAPPQVQDITTCRRLASGESSILGCFETRSGGTLAVIVTAKVID